MDRIEPQELLSAYLDGEVTPAERAEAEQLLESSPELRGDLEAFARLSDLIRGLPREAAPSDLAAAIRQQAERQSLLGRAPSVPKRSFRREIVSVLIGMAVTAAGMLIMVRTVDRGDERLSQTDKPVAAISADRTASAKGNSTADDSLVAMEAAASAPADFAMQGRADATPEAFAPAAGILAKKSGPAPGKPIPELAKSKALVRDGSLDAAAAELAETNSGLNLRSVRIGDIVPYWERNANDVAVVVMTVVDIEQTADQMEVLLERYDVPVIQESASGADESAAAEEKSRVRRGKKSRAVNAGDLVTVYFDVPGSDLAELLHEMDDRELFLTAQLQPPVDLPPMIDAEKLAEQPHSSRREQDLAKNEAEQEQIVKQEATEATNMYVNRTASIDRLPAADASNQSHLEQKSGSASPLRRMTAGSQNARGSVNSDRKPSQRFVKKDFAEDGPADAASAVQPAPQQSNLTRQRNHIAVQNTVNTAQALSTNSANSAVKHKGAVVEPTPRAAEDKADSAGDLLIAEPAPTKSVRLLLVLQQAPPAGAPQE